RDRFASQLFARMSSVSPSCKFRYLAAGFQLVDPRDPKAEEAAKVYDYYKDLVTELELVTRIDGDTAIGHEDAFGVYVDLRHTRELEREAGGFAKYLQNQNNGYYSYNYGRPTENYRDKFQDAATAILQDQFEVLSVTFNHPETKSVDAGNGWRVTPYAYLLLRAKGPEVDKLPTLKIDLDFLDTSGYVVLPISSSPVAIDASNQVPRDFADPEKTNLNLVQVLDERQSGDGKLIVEAHAVSRGLIPSLDQMLDTSIKGFELADVEDSDVSIVEFDKDGSDTVIVSERTWTMTYASSDPNGQTPDEFVFPQPRVETKEIAYQRYVDADLQDVQPTLALTQDYGNNRRHYSMIAALAAAAGLLFIAILVLARRILQAPDADEETHQVSVTPVSILTQLRQTRASGSVGSDRLPQLQQDISAVEQHYFAPDNGKAEPDLHAIAARWA
ncbi:MAG: hypothetical protein AAFP69_22405, partial [Planctomycetota bacterium]